MFEKKTDLIERRLCCKMQHSTLHTSTQFALRRVQNEIAQDLVLTCL